MINIHNWDVENNDFWNSTGKYIAARNLWISIPALLLGFSIWIMWGVIIVQMQNLGFIFSSDPGTNKAMLYTLPAIAGLAGATLRIPNSFLIAIGGGRNVIAVTTGLLLIPAIGAGIALQNKETPYMVFAILAATSGFGGGNFASSMSNISYFFPKRVQGTSLGLNAGLGNLGVSVMQFLLPITMGMALFGAFGGEGIKLNDQMIYIQNAGLTWVPILVVVTIAAWFGMNNLKSATPVFNPAIIAIAKILFLLLLGITGAGIGAYLLLGLGMNMWVVLPVTIIITVLLMKYLSPGTIKGSLANQFEIFKDKHNWIMTIIYTMTFGSFIGFSNAFPKLIQDVFKYHPVSNPDAPNPLVWAFLGPMVGALIRPVGGWFADKINSGSRVTAYSTILQILSALGVAYFIIQARQSDSPNDYWWPFFILFMLLFIATGIGNGSTFRSIPYIFSKKLAGPVLGWTSAIAAYGAFIIPKVFGQQIKAGTPEYALYGFALYYFFCLALNWWYYDRRNSKIKC